MKLLERTKKNILNFLPVTGVVAVIAIALTDSLEGGSSLVALMLVGVAVFLVGFILSFVFSIIEQWKRQD